MCLMDHNQLQQLTKQIIKEKELYKEFKFPSPLRSTEKLEDIKQKILNEQISYRKWLTVHIKQLHLDVLLQTQQNLKAQPCVLLNSQSEVQQLNKIAYDLGIRTEMTEQMLQSIHPNVNILKIQNIANIQESFNLILRYLQQIDKEVEIDQNNQITLFQLDITNYMSEKGFENPNEVAASVIKYIQTEFKVESFAGVGTNSLLSLLASHLSISSFETNHNRSRIVEIKDFTSHHHLDMKILTKLSQSLQEQLNLLGIFKISDILTQQINIFETFPRHLTESLLKIYYGIGRMRKILNTLMILQLGYHNISIEIDSLKVSRVLKLGEYSIKQLQSQVEQIIQQLILDMKHYKKIAKTVKLQLTKIDHTNLIAKREFQRIDSDYFDLFKTECFQMLKSLQITNLLLQKITIQVFEMKPLDSIEIINTTFAQRFYKALQQQQQQLKDQKRSSSIGINRETLNKLNTSQIIPSTLPKLPQHQSIINDATNMARQQYQQQFLEIQKEMQMQKQNQQQSQFNYFKNLQNISNTTSQQQTTQKQTKQQDIQERTQNSINNSINNSNKTLNQNQNVNNHENSYNQNKHSMNQVQQAKENESNFKQMNNNNIIPNQKPKQQEQSLIQTQSKPTNNQKGQSNSINWFANRMTPVSEGAESEKLSNMSDNSSKFKYQNSMHSNLAKTNNNSNQRESFINMASTQIQKNDRNSLNDIKLNLNHLYDNLSEQDKISKLLLNDSLQDGYRSDDSISNILQENKRKSRILVQDSITEDEESNFTFQGVFKEMPQHRQDSSFSVFQDKELSIFEQNYLQKSNSISFPSISQQHEKDQKSIASSEKKIISKQGSNLSDSKEDSINEINSQSSQSSRFEANSNLLASKKQYLNEKFTCPLCGNQIDCKGNYSYINSHIDKCLEKQTKEHEHIERDVHQTTSNHNSSSHSIMNTDHQNKKRPVLITEQTNQSLSKQSKRGRPLGSKNSSHQQKTQQQQQQQQSNSLFAFGFKK